MTQPLHPILWRYLRRIQRSARVGVHARAREHKEVTSRTVYRWQRRFANQLLIMPSVAVERLGLVHCHLFITTPGDEWLSLGYAVEASILTQDLCRDILYLHCLVPKERQTQIESLVRTLPCAAHELVWSSTGWQQFLQAGDVIELAMPDTGRLDTALVRRHPLLIPTILESWRYPNSLPVIWQRARSTLQERVKAYLPRTRIHYTNGSTHVTAMYKVLHAEGLLQQHMIRYHPLLAASIEVFLAIQTARADLLALLEKLRSSLYAIETYATADGYLCRLLGPHQLMDAILNLSEHARSRIRRLLFHTKRHPGPSVRFAYERLFNPQTGAWEVPA